MRGRGQRLSCGRFEAGRKIARNQPYRPSSRSRGSHIRTLRSGRFHRTVTFGSLLSACRWVNCCVSLTALVGGAMAAPHLPSPEPERTHKKTEPTGTAETPMRQRYFEIVRSISKAPALQKHLHAVMKKRWLRVAGIAVAVLVVLLIALPFLINVNSFRPKIESEATNALGRQVKLGDLSLSILSGTDGVEDISIADDPAFSKSPFVTAKSLQVGVELMPLIFSKQLNVTDITLEAPQITLLKTPSGKWNFSNIGAASAQKTPESPKAGGSALPNFSIAKLNVNHGKLLVGKANSSVKPVVYDDLNISVKNFSFTSQFPFQLTAQLP